jgi:hypothetical protein
VENKEVFFRISSIICQGFTFLDNDSANIFNSLGDYVRVYSDEVKKIDFEIPKPKL